MRVLLKGLRKSNRLSVHDMAEKLKISDSFYYKIESGVRNPTIILAKKICCIIGGNIEENFISYIMDEMSDDNYNSNNVS